MLNVSMDQDVELQPDVNEEHTTKLKVCIKYEIPQNKQQLLR